jgi:multisubunit Na+/H+ antiporter MnhB subunit
MPRFLFPGKAALSDSEVYTRLARRLTMEEVREGTSISVGYMGENFADLGFPGMLFGVAVLGLIMAAVARVLMSFDLPQIMREGMLMAFAITVSRDGVEVSLAKTLGATVMFLVAFLLLNKVFFPRVLQWLEHRSRGLRYQHT